MPGIEYIKLYNLDAISSVLGLALTIIGFCITIYNVKKSRKAAQDAADKTQKISDTIFRVDKLLEIEKTLNLIEDIKRMNSTGEILICSQFYSTARKSLITFREYFVDMNDSEQSVIQEFITSLSRCETLVDKAKMDETPLNFAKINGQLNSSMDSMTKLLAKLKLKIGK